MRCPAAYIGGMVLRRQIQRRLAQPDAVEAIRQLVEVQPSMHRTELADRLCDRFGFLDARGRRQRTGCLKALRVLASRGLFALPPPQTKTGPATPRRLEQSVPPPGGVPRSAGEIRGLELVVVESEEAMRLWNELFIREHPRGAGPLVGRQLRYLIRSEHGWLGGLAFAAAALQLGDRDRWIGWDVQARRANLDRVVGLSRFLIRPSVRCRNLASRVLGMAVVRLPEDFEARYGYRPWLVETFVDTSSHSGTCFQASNWIRIGSSRGRGRQDRGRRRSETVKDIYVYELEQDFRDRMGLPAHSGLGPLAVDAGLESEIWAEQELGGAPLGDRRLSKRLVRSAMAQAGDPMRAFSGVARVDRALVKGHYRFIDQPDESAVTMENILAPHRERTVRRMKAQKTVLCIQDGTDLDFNALADCEGLGVIGTNQTGAQSRGLHLHSTLAVSTAGLPLGVLRTQCWAPLSRPKEDTRPATEIPIEEKDTYCWILGMRDCRSVAAGMPHTRVVSVMDREADIFELFDEWRQDPSIDLLVRAKHNRCLTDGKKLFEAVQASEPRLRLQIFLGRQSARPKRSKQKARPKRKERVAESVLRYQRIELRPPPYHGGKEPIALWIIHVAEENPPAGVKPIGWFLLTTMEITSPEQAERSLGWYCLRWRIEDWHRVLKSGCKPEELQHKTAERLKRAIAMHAVIAWRIMLMTLLGRETPDLPPEVLFSDIEIEVLEAFAKTRKYLKPPARLGDAVLLVAALGGYLARKSDGPPGHQRMWYGYITLRGMCAGYVLARETAAAR